MKKLISFSALTLAGVVFTVSIYFCVFFYNRYYTEVTALEHRLNAFEMRLGKLETHKAKGFSVDHVGGMISTTDRPLEEVFGNRTNGSGLPGGYFTTGLSKSGRFVRPELRIPFSTTTNAEFDLYIALRGDAGPIAGAWLSHAEPYQDLAAFEQFTAWYLHNTNVVRIIAKPKPGASISMRFDLVVLYQAENGSDRVLPPEPKPFNYNLLLLPAVGIGLYIAGLVYRRRLKPGVDGYVPVIGTVVHTDIPHLTVVEYFVDNRRYEIRSFRGRRQDAVGRKLEVLCSPASPQIAVLTEDHFYPAKLVMMLGSILTVIGTAIFCLMLFTNK